MTVKPITVVETRPFIAACKGVLTAEEVATLVDRLATHPKAGAVIQGTGGVRKIRVAAKRGGKSGGARAIYYYVDEGMPIFLLTVFGKGQKGNLTKAERNALVSVIGEIGDTYGA